MAPLQLKVIAAALLLLPACAPVDAGLGNAVRQNVAAQVIDPDPQYRGTPIEAGSGDRAALAMRRYREGRVIEPRPNSGSQPFQAAGQGAAGAAAGPR